MRKKTSVFLSGLLTASSLFTGCSAPMTNATPGADATRANSPTSQDDNPANAGILADQDNGTVALTLWGAEEDGALLTRIIEDFKQEYAREASFDITLEYGSESSCKDALLADPENGADVFAFADDQLRVLVAAGILDRVADDSGIRADNIEGAWQASSIHDTLYAYPMTADNGYFLYYNKAYFSEADVKSLDTILEKAAIAQKLVTMDWTSGWYLYSFFGETGLELGMNDDGVSNYCNWNATDTTIKGTDVARALLDISANPAFASTTDEGFVAGVLDGTVIAGVSGVWNANTVEQAWGSDYGAAKLPTYTCAGRQIQMSSFAGYKMIGVNAYSDHPDWAGKLAAWITNEENQTLRFQMRGQGPSNIRAAGSPQVAASPAIQAILAQSESASLQRVGGTFWEPVQIFGQTMGEGNPQNTSLQDLLDTMVQGITLSYH